MSRKPSNFLTSTESKTTSRHPQATPSTSTEPNMYKSGTVVTRDTAKMAAYAPVEIGTKGTVGSLIMREIEHFSQLELSSQCSSRKAQPQLKDPVSYLKPTFESVIKPQKKKKRGSKLLASVCSMVEVSENNRPTSISTYSYRNLRSDGKKLPGFLGLMPLLLPLLLAPQGTEKEAV
ncbi:hypothetical protein ACFX13_031309 [Malus domestica]|nr:uncharacterized protein LOC126614779 [Malus sylvestris]